MGNEGQSGLIDFMAGNQLRARCEAQKQWFARRIVPEGEPQSAWSTAMGVSWPTASMASRKLEGEGNESRGRHYYG
jgi:hypothetical protein